MPALFTRMSKIAELLQNFAVSSLNIRLHRHVGVDWMHPQFSRRLRQPALVGPVMATRARL